MPYSTNAELPKQVQELPEKAKSIWRNTFNSAYEESGEQSAIKQAWGAVKNAGYEKDEKTGKYSKVEKQKFIPPAAGENAPKKLREILLDVYSECRAKWVKDHPNDKENKSNKESCARIAWNAVRNAGFKQDKEGNWKMAKNYIGVDADSVLAFLMSEDGQNLINTMVRKAQSFQLHPDENIVDIKKIDDDKQYVFGFFSVCSKDDENILDHENSMIEEHELEKAVYDYVLNARIAGEVHIKKGVGDLIESMMFTKEKQDLLGIDLGMVGWWGGFHIHDEDVWGKVKKGEYVMFSIGGKAMKEYID